MDNAKRIQGKIAAVVSDTALIINRGSSDGVEHEMKFGIFYELPEVVDPDDPTNTLDGIIYRKATLTVTSVYEKMSFCRVEPKRTRILGPHAGLVTDEYPVLSGKRLLPAGWDVISVGDIVKQLRGETKTK